MNQQICEIKNKIGDDLFKDPKWQIDGAVK